MTGPRRAEVVPAEFAALLSVADAAALVACRDYWATRASVRDHPTAWRYVELCEAEISRRNLD